VWIGAKFPLLFLLPIPYRHDVYIWVFLVGYVYYLDVKFHMLIISKRCEIMVIMRIGDWLTDRTR